jgi:hypothetical protein
MPLIPLDVCTNKFSYLVFNQAFSVVFLLNLMLKFKISCLENVILPYNVLYNENSPIPANHPSFIKSIYNSDKKHNFSKSMTYRLASVAPSCCILYKIRVLPMDVIVAATVYCGPNNIPLQVRFYRTIAICTSILLDEK